MPKYSSGAHDTSSRSIGLSSTKCWSTTRGIAQPHRRYRGLRTVCGDHDTCAIIELNHLEPGFFAPLCEDPDMCRDADMCEDTDDYGMRIEDRLFDRGWVRSAMATRKCGNNYFPKYFMAVRPFLTRKCFQELFGLEGSNISLKTFVSTI